MISSEEVLAKIKSRGYWKVNLRPLRFKEDRISSLRECDELIRQCKVTLRGWDYPHVDTRNPPRSGLNWVEGLTDWGMYKELWRMYQSGQFLHLFGCKEDWLKEDVTIFGPSKYADIEPCSILDVINTLYQITEIFEFASRLAQKRLFNDGLRIIVELHNMQNRKLTMAFSPGRSLYNDYICNLRDIPHPSISISVDEIISRRHELALECAVWFFERFNWYSPNIVVLKEDQKKFIEQRLG